MYARDTSEFWHIRQNFVYSGLCRQVQTYSDLVIGILTHIETLLRHIQAYSGIFNPLHNPRMFTTLAYFKPWHI